MTMGDGITDTKVDLGPMATADGVETAHAHVSDAVHRGATLVCGGRKPDGEAFAKGNYYLPTIVTGCTQTMRVMQEETFAAVVPFAKFDTLDEAITLANDTAYGLVAYLFTRDYAATVRASEALEAGTVCVNHGAVNTNYAPYAGWKDSGYGVELSRRAVFRSQTQARQSRAVVKNEEEREEGRRRAAQSFARFEKCPRHPDRCSRALRQLVPSSSSSRSRPPQDALDPIQARAQFADAFAR